jgi:hypothetical protein
MKLATTIGAVIAATVGILALVFVLSLVFSLPVYWLWNWLCPELFGLKTITWFQAWGLLVLTGFLFKSSTSTKSS